MDEGIVGRFSFRYRRDDGGVPSAIEQEQPIPLRRHGQPASAALRIRWKWGRCRCRASSSSVSSRRGCCDVGSPPARSSVSSASVAPARRRCRAPDSRRAGRSRTRRQRAASGGGTARRSPPRAPRCLYSGRRRPPSCSGGLRDRATIDPFARAHASWTWKETDSGLSVAGRRVSAPAGGDGAGGQSGGGAQRGARARPAGRARGADAAAPRSDGGVGSTHVPGVGTGSRRGGRRAPAGSRGSAGCRSA